MKLLVDTFWTLVFFTDREAGDTRPPVLLLLAVVVVAVVLLVAWHGITRAILQVAPWAGPYLHWWFIGGLLVLGLVVAEGAAKEAGR
jgi:tryptophan-rich sensory protein